MIRSFKGSMTIVLSLSMMVFLLFCLVLTEGIRNYYLKAKAQQAMELAEFSVLSEYQSELFRQYGVFFLDLDYEQGTEQTALLETRLEDYFCRNTEDLFEVYVAADQWERATDAEGSPFFQQAVTFMKVQSGYQWIEDLSGKTGSLGKSLDLGKLLEENTAEAVQILEQFTGEDGEPLFDISLPEVSFPSVEVLTEAVFGTRENLSGKTIELSERLEHRKLQTGSGIAEENGFLDMQMFHGYLLKYMNHYGSSDPERWNESLEYQIEYIIAGEAEDQKNLEQVMWRIFLLRAGGNYLLFHKDAGKTAEAEAEAVLLTGAAGNPVLTKIVREILLISKAIEAAVEETKRVFAGEKVPLYEDGIFQNISMGYEQYLYVFLNTTDSAKKIYRCMDVIELEVRKKCGYEQFRMDHCVDQFRAEWTWQMESLFMRIPWSEGGVYENTIQRNVYYEK